MELKDMKLLTSDSKHLYKLYRNNYCRIIDNLKSKYSAKPFSGAFYAFMIKNGVEEKFVEKLEKKYNDYMLPEELVMKENYYYSLLLASQLEGSELCFGKMIRVGKTFTACWIERKNFVLDLISGVLYNKDFSADNYYNSFGISKNEIVRISQTKLTQSKESLDEVVNLLKKYDNHKKSDYKLAYNAIKEGK